MARDVVNEILGEQLSTAEILERTAPEDIADVVAILRRHRPRDEICAELIKLLSTIPIKQFNRVKAVYVRNCSGEE